LSDAEILTSKAAKATETQGVTRGTKETREADETRMPSTSAKMENRNTSKLHKTGEHNLIQGDELADLSRELSPGNGHEFEDQLDLRRMRNMDQKGRNFARHGQKPPVHEEEDSQPSHSRPVGREYDPHKLHVLGQELNIEEIQKLFSAYGTVLDVSQIRVHAYDQIGRKDGEDQAQYCFVT
jgi:hypothetical protein